MTIVSDSSDKLGRTYGIFGLNMPCHLTYDEFETKKAIFSTDFDLLVLPGGVKSLEKLRQEVSVIDFIRNWSTSGKIISSTCHGAQLLISAGITKGHVIAGYYSLQVDVENSGATYSREPVVTSGNIVTSPHYDFMGEWMEETLRMVDQQLANG